MKFKGISSTPAAFVLIDITALRTSSSETETGSTKTNPVLNDGLVKKKKLLSRSTSTPLNLSRPLMTPSLRRLSYNFFDGRPGSRLTETNSEY
jgi:hypothetical protein